MGLNYAILVDSWAAHLKMIFTNEIPVMRVMKTEILVDSWRWMKCYINQLAQRDTLQMI